MSPAATVLPDRLAELEHFELLEGSHGGFDDGVCAMEAVAWLAGEPHSDHPQCACPVIGSFVRAWNDGLPDDATRKRLLMPLVPRLVGSRSTPAAEDARAWLATDWLVRVFTPAFLDLVPSLRDHARALGGLPPVLSREAAIAAQPALNEARSACAAACAAVWDAAGDAASAAAWDAASAAARAAARDATWAAAWDAARDAAWDAASAAAWAAAWDAASAAARDAAWAAASAAARDAAWDAAWDAASAAAWAAAWDAASAAARDAAWAAASAALRGAVDRLQSSAVALVAQMLAVQGVRP